MRPSCCELGSHWQKDIPAYVILGVCNPNMGLKVLEADWNAGITLPCTVFVRQGAAVDRFVVGAINAAHTVGSQRDDSPALKEVAEETATKMRAVLESLRTP